MKTVFYIVTTLINLTYEMTKKKKKMPKEEGKTRTYYNVLIRTYL